MVDYAERQSEEIKILTCSTVHDDGSVSWGHGSFQRWKFCPETVKVNVHCCTLRRNPLEFNAMKTTECSRMSAFERMEHLKEAIFRHLPTAKQKWRASWKSFLHYSLLPLILTRYGNLLRIWEAALQLQKSNSRTVRSLTNQFTFREDIASTWLHHTNTRIHWSFPTTSPYGS